MVEHDVKKRSRLGGGCCWMKQIIATTPAYDSIAYIWKANNHSWFVLRFNLLHNTLALLISRNPQLSCSKSGTGRFTGRVSWSRSLGRSLYVNNKQHDFWDSKRGQDHDILATVPRYAYPRYPRDWGHIPCFGIILENGCSKNFLHPKNRSSNAKYGQSCSFNILFDIAKPSALHFESRLSPHFQRCLPLQAPATEEISHSAQLRSKANFHLHGEVHPGGVPSVFLREVTSTNCKKCVHLIQVSSLAVSKQGTSAFEMPWYWPCESQRHPTLNFKSCMALQTSYLLSECRAAY